MSKEMTWRKAIEKVLRDSQVALHYNDITQSIIDNGYRINLGATPATSVGSILATAINSEGPNCPFDRTERGVYFWKRSVEPGVGAEAQGACQADRSDDSNIEPQYAIITSFGMFWRRDAIEWTSSPKLLGMQKIGSTPVDFNRQTGVYLLYDGREVIYVGRTTDRPLGKRLYEHTMDRFSARWDRFSWFGLAPVSDNGELGAVPQSVQLNTLDTLVPTMEAILIEALEPRQNRKRGDDLSTVEYIQKEDPDIQKKRAFQVMAAAINGGHR